MALPTPTPELYRQLFEDDKRGAAILDQLERLFSKPAELHGENAALVTYHRMGARSVIEHILNQINRANGAHVQEGEDDAPQEIQVVQR